MSNRLCIFSRCRVGRGKIIVAGRISREKPCPNTGSQEVSARHLVALRRMAFGLGKTLISRYVIFGFLAFYEVIIFDKNSDLRI
jgi:hypothetical protein